MSDLPNYLEGIPKMYGVKQASPDSSQGNDVEIEFDLSYKGKPLIDTKDWVLEVFVKKSLKAVNILWKCELGNDFYRVVNNHYVFRIPARSTANIVPGSYFFTVRGSQKIGTSELYDIVGNLHSGMFTVSLDAASPNPKITGSTLQTVVLDLTDFSYKIVIEGTENTEPGAGETISS